jgi:APA family basic amino acid/polyamine antiporter
VAPAGAFVSFAMMAFLPLDTWARLLVWLALGLAIYFLYGIRHSHLGRELESSIKTYGMSPTDAPLE